MVLGFGMDQLSTGGMNITNGNNQRSLLEGLSPAKGPGGRPYAQRTLSEPERGTMRPEEALDAIADKLREMRPVGYQMRSYVTHRDDLRQCEARAA